MAPKRNLSVDPTSFPEPKRRTRSLIPSSTRRRKELEAAADAAALDAYLGLVAKPEKKKKKKQLPSSNVPIESIPEETVNIQEDIDDIPERVEEAVPITVHSDPAADDRIENSDPTINVEDALVDFLALGPPPVPSTPLSTARTDLTPPTQLLSAQGTLQRVVRTPPRSASPASLLLCNTLPLARTPVRTPIASDLERIVPLPPLTTVIDDMVPLQALDVNSQVETSIAEPRHVQRAQYESQGLADEGEVLHIVQQVIHACGFLLRAVGPFVLAGVLYCYILNKLSGSQIAAAVGLQLVFFFTFSFGIFAFACFPFILIARFITNCVSDTSFSFEEQRETNLYARIALFATVLSLVFVICLSVGETA